MAASFIILRPIESVKTHLTIPPAKTAAENGRLSEPASDISTKDATPAILEPEKINPPKNENRKPVLIFNALYHIKNAYFVGITT